MFGGFDRKVDENKLHFYQCYLLPNLHFCICVHIFAFVCIIWHFYAYFGSFCTIWARCSIWSEQLLRRAKTTANFPTKRRQRTTCVISVQEEKPTRCWWHGWVGDVGMLRQYAEEVGSQFSLKDGWMDTSIHGSQLLSRGMKSLQIYYHN